MIEITSICKKYKKRAPHFTDNLKLDTTGVIARGGIGGGTQIPERLLTDFLMWLSPETREMVGEIGAKATLDFIRHNHQP